MTPKTVSFPRPAVFVAIELEGRVWLGSTDEPAETARLVDWLAARAEAEPDVRELLEVALRFASVDTDRSGPDGEMQD